jgi:hypothetical protein
MELLPWDRGSGLQCKKYDQKSVAGITASMLPFFVKKDTAVEATCINC